MSGTVVPPRPCHHVIVAVPARDEQDTIAETLASIDRAATRVSAPVTISLAADSCGDDTVHVARALPLRRARLVVVEGDWGRAGAARASAVTHALDRLDRDAACWIANTDADCRVPLDWLEIQLRYARAAAAVAGIVALDPETTPAHILIAFRRTYHVDGDRHHHVHGANLGVWADAYTAAGGWCTRTVVGEDHALWNAVRAGGFPVTQTAALTVVTSARTRGRVYGGFATNLSHHDHAHHDHPHHDHAHHDHPLRDHPLRDHAHHDHALHDHAHHDHASSAPSGRSHDPDPFGRAESLVATPPAA